MRRLATNLTAVAALAVLGGSLPFASAPAAAKPVRVQCADNGVHEQINREEIVRRAHSWLGGTKEDSTTDTVDYHGDRVGYAPDACHTNLYGTYRRDSAGFVAMAWGLGGNGGQWTPASLRGHATTVASKDLAPGDALLTGDHAALFMRWAGSDAVVYEQSPATGRARVSTWSKDRVEASTPSRAINATNRLASGGEGYLTLITPSGTIGWYYHSNWMYGGSNFSSIWFGSGFNMFTKVAVEHRTLYGITPDGLMRWYRLEANGTYHPRSGTVIGQGWQDTKFLMASGYGLVYRVSYSGNLYWYGYHGVPQEGGYWDNSGVGKFIGSGWAGFRNVSAWLGTFFPVQPNGDLLWYKYYDWGTGTLRPPTQDDEGSWSWLSSYRVGTGWGPRPQCGFRDVSHAGLGRMYAVDDTGYLRHLWYADYNEPAEPLLWFPSIQCGWSYGPGW